MALKKAKTLSNGITADYWKIVDCDVKKDKVLIALFVDQNAAKQRRNMLDGRVAIDIDWDLEALEADGMNPLKYAYTKIKESKMSVWENEEKDGAEDDFVPVETNFFADAEDC